MPVDVPSQSRTSHPHWVGHCPTICIGSSDAIYLWKNGMAITPCLFDRDHYFLK
jgi:hypothetical protein